MRPAILNVLLCLGFLAPASAQSSYPLITVYGQVTDSLSGAGIEGVEILLPFQKRMVVTGRDGQFTIDGLRPGVFGICLGGGSEAPDTLRFLADGRHPVLPPILTAALAPIPSSEAAIPESPAPTADADDDGPAAAEYAAPTGAGRDPFVDATTFNLFPFRFQPRGYNRRIQEVYLNTAPVNDPATQQVMWSSWSGLTDAFRSREQRYGLGASGGLFGGLGGSLGFDITAAAQRPQQRFTAALGNRSYRSRLAYSRSSGVLPSGWAWACNAAYRVAASGFVPGTFQEGAAVYVAGSRMFSAAHSLHLSLVGAWNLAGRNAAVTEETVSCSGDAWYNPNWGLQQGRVRNARISEAFQPFALLTHQYRPGKRFRAESSLMLQAGKSSNSGLDYYNASNPRPDYYRYLPSYLALGGRDPALAAFLTRPQIDWDGLYMQNRVQWDSIRNANGVTGSTIAGRRSVYAVFRDVQALRKLSGAFALQWIPVRGVMLSGGISAVVQAEERYRELADLLGGDFYLNTNPFIDGGPDGRLAQYDLGVPDRVIREGDRYGYDYEARSRELAAWCGLQGSLSRIDYHLEGRVLQRAFARVGRFRNGLFPDESYGPGAACTVNGYVLKAGVSYRLNGRTQLLANAVYAGNPPGFDQVFVAPRIRNTLNAAASVEALHGLELGVAHRSGPLHLHLQGFATRRRGASEIRRYYSDDPAFASFVNYLMTGISRQYTGLEFGAALKPAATVEIRTALALTDAFYAANPTGVTIYGDNDTAQQPVQRQVYLRNLALATGPQTAATLGITYRSPRYWYAGLTANCAARSFVDVNPDRRTEAAVRGLDPGSETYRSILGQEQLPGTWTLDLSAGKNWMLSRYVRHLPKNTFLYLNMALSNMLDRRYRTGGYEQLRFDYAGQDPGKFASKYFYAPGRNFLLSLGLRW